MGIKIYFINNGSKGAQRYGTSHIWGNHYKITKISKIIVYDIDFDMIHEKCNDTLFLCKMVYWILYKYYTNNF